MKKTFFDFKMTFFHLAAVLISLLGMSVVGRCEENSSKIQRTEWTEFLFQPAPKRSGTGMRIEQVNNNSVRFAMTSAKSFGSESMIARFQYESMAQQKLVLRVRGRRENGTAFFHPILFIQKDGKTRSVTGPPIPANAADWHLYVFGLDTDFQLGDASYTIKGLEFSFNSAREPIDRELSLEVEKIRLANPNDISDRKKYRFQVHRAPDGMFAPMAKNSARPIQENPVKPVAVYFDFDNNDCQTGIFVAQKTKSVPDEYCGDFGYRDLLLENCPLFTVADTPAQADLIVYQRTVPSKNAAEIARLVSGGKPLVLYGAIPDPEIAALAPMTLSRLPNSQLAVREKLTKTASDSVSSADSVASLTHLLPLQNCTFGRYFEAKPVDDASVLLTFADSRVPYLVQKGNVLHFAGTSGTNLIESRVFYDKAALLYWSALTGTARAEKVVDQIAQCESAIPEIKTRRKNGLLWYQTTRGFGRFGWLVAEPGLVDLVASDLTIYNGDQMYRFDAYRNNEESTSPDTKSNLSKDVCPVMGYCNEISKEYRFTPSGNVGQTSLTMSLLSPFELWQFEKADRVFLTQENIADFVAWKTEKGVKVVSLKELKETRSLYDEQRDGPWSAPWLLLYREKNARPLLLVFPSQPKKIVATIRYGLLDGFELTLGKEKTVLAGWPWGVIQRELSDWSKAIPEETIQKINDALGLALHYPIDRRETFALDNANGRIHFRMDVKYLTFANDWKTTVKPVVCLPPMTAYMEQLKKEKENESLSQLVQTDEKLRDFDIPTPFGPMVGKTGTYIEWSLPLPGSEDLLMVNVKDSKLNALQNKLFLDGVKWTCGGHVPMDRLTPAHPAGPGIDEPNISHFNWNFGMGTALQSALILNEEAKKQLERRVIIRAVEPLELYQYKFFARHRSEPFSGLRYPVMFNSFYPNETQYEAKFGSQVIYGDTNEAATVVAWTGQELADIYGQADLIRANWSFYRYVMRHQLYIDDYCYQAGSCRESGAGAWIDMLNAEYSGLLAYARLAEIVGDDAVRAEALSRAAKRAVPTIARLYFKPWLERIHPEFSEKNYLITGFGEGGAKTMGFPRHSASFNANELFNYSQGVPGTQFYLYRRFAKKPLETYLKDIALPQLALSERPAYAYLTPLALYCPDEKPVNDYAAAILARPENLKAEDWPGMCYPVEIAAWLWRMNGQVAFSRFENLKFVEAQYDPDSRCLKAEYIGQSDSRLELSSGVVPVRMTVNKKPVNSPPTPENGKERYITPISVVPGLNKLEVQF